MLLSLRTWCVAVAVPLSLSAGLAQAQESRARIGTSPAGTERPVDDKALDATRRPLDVLEFLAIDAGMTVLDVIAEYGWYTEVLSVAVGSQGKVYSQNPRWLLQSRGQEMVDAIEVRATRLGNVELLHENFDALGLSNEVDAAITALNLHDMYTRVEDEYPRQGEERAMLFLGSIYDALKPGGVLGMIDHVGVAGQDNVELHRIEIADARRFLTQAGFVIEAESDLLRNQDDNHTLHMGAPAIRFKTDRMLFRARKPAVAP